MPNFTLDIRFKDHDPKKAGSVQITITSESEALAKEAAKAVVSEMDTRAISKITVVERAAAPDDMDRNVWEAGYEAGEEHMRSDFHRVFEQVDGWPENVDAASAVQLATWAREQMRDIEILRSQVIQLKEELQGAYNDVREAGS